jgi:hypothetical protein
MTKEQEEFLKSFKAGEYAELTLLVDIIDLPRLIDALQKIGIKTAMFPKVKAEIDFATDNKCGAV